MDYPRPANVQKLIEASPMASVQLMLSHIGEDVDRDGLLDTPSRVVKSWDELYSGYKEDPRDHLKKQFDCHASQMVAVNGIEFFSTCEHHLLPFYGTVDVSYIPSKKVVGLSKIARMVNGYARRAQIQERLTEQIADAMDEIKGTIGVAIRVRAMHLCMVARGVRIGGAQMTTTALRGGIKDNTDAKSEWMMGLPS
jgi:GTP cyclohydrolase I